MKKTISILLMMVMLVPLLFACVSRQDYDALMAEYEALRARVESAESNLAAAQTKNSGLTSSLEKTEADIGITQTELEATEAKNAGLSSSLEKTEADLETMQTELETTQAKNSGLTSSLEKSRSKLAAIKDENEDLEQANEKLERLMFVETALCSIKPEPGNIKPKADNTFKTSETVWVFALVTGWKYILVGQEVETSWTWSIKILDAEGEVVDSEGKSGTESHDRPFGNHGFYEPFGPLEAGNYTVEIEYTDHFSGETITWKEEFKVVSR